MRRRARRRVLRLLEFIRLAFGSVVLARWEWGEGWFTGCEGHGCELVIWREGFRGLEEEMERRDLG